MTTKVGERAARRGRLCEELQCLLSSCSAHLTFLSTIHKERIVRNRLLMTDERRVEEVAGSKRGKIHVVKETVCDRKINCRRAGEKTWTCLKCKHLTAPKRSSSMLECKISFVITVHLWFIRRPRSFSSCCWCVGGSSITILPLLVQIIGTFATATIFVQCVGKHVTVSRYCRFCVRP